jgi:hypothetical protein
MKKMLVWAGAAYQNVVQVAEGKIQSAQHLVHESLEGLAGVPQPKRHAEEFPQPKRIDHRSPVDVAFLDGYLVVTLL